MKTGRSSTANRFFETGERSNTIVEALRDSKAEHLSIEDIANAIVKRRGMKLHEREFKKLVATLHDGLRTLRLKGTVVTINRADGKDQFALKSD